MKHLFSAVLSALILATALSACGSEADTVNENLGKEAERFQIVRKIVGVNAITDRTVFEITGRCSLEQNGALPRNLEVICKNGPNDYSKHFVGLSDNLFWVSTQLEGVDVDAYRTKFIFRPQSLIPDIDLVTGEQG
jgi:steroid 5-alpha reductase family enzyme